MVLVHANSKKEIYGQPADCTLFGMSFCIAFLD